MILGAMHSLDRSPIIKLGLLGLHLANTLLIDHTSHTNDGNKDNRTYHDSSYDESFVAVKRFVTQEVGVAVGVVEGAGEGIGGGIHDDGRFDDGSVVCGVPE